MQGEKWDTMAIFGQSQPHEGNYSMQDTLEQRCALIDELLTDMFNSVLRIEERVLENRLTRGLTITEVHAIVAIGYRESNPMGVVATRLGVTLATLTTTAARLEEKGYVVRTRDERDRRKVLISLTTRGREVYRAHGLFHKHMVKSALAGLTDQEQEILARSLSQVKGFFDEQA